MFFMNTVFVFSIFYSFSYKIQYILQLSLSISSFCFLRNEYTLINVLVIDPQPGISYKIFLPLPSCALIVGHIPEIILLVILSVVPVLNAADILDGTSTALVVS